MSVSVHVPRITNLYREEFPKVFEDVLLHWKSVQNLSHGIFDRIVFKDDVTKVFYLPERKVFMCGEFHSHNDSANRNFIPEMIQLLQL